MAVLFSKTFDVSAGTGLTYASFIEELRTALKVPNKFILGRPVLPRLADGGPPFFDVDLKLGDLKLAEKTVKIRLRTDNLYVEGYTCGKDWYEFKNSTNTHLIAGAKWMRFQGNYDALENEAMPPGQKVQSVTRSNVALGQPNLTRAVKELDPERPENHQNARSMIVIIQTLSEAIRLHNVSSFIAMNWVGGSVPPQKLLACENAWGKLSESLVKKDQDNSGYTLDQNLKNQTEVKTYQDCIDIVAMVYKP